MWSALWPRDLFMIYSLNGERCTSSTRALVQRSIYPMLTEKMVERVGKITVEHDMDQDPQGWSR